MRSTTAVRRSAAVAVRRLGLGVALLVATGACAVAADEVVRGHARALDGDTLMIGETRVRLFGVDAPEMTDPRGPVSRGQLDELIDGRQVSCTPTGAKSHGRPVARCNVAGRDLGDAMIRNGWAFAYRTFTAEYDEAEAKAREMGVGFWQRPDETSWWDKAAAIGQFVAAIGIFGAVVIAAIFHRWQREWEIAQERKALASALLGEVEAIFSIIEARRYEAAFAGALRAWSMYVAYADWLAPRPTLPYIPVREDYFAVFTSNTDKVGLLPTPLPQQLTQLYIMLRSIKEDFLSINEGLWKEEPGEEVVEFIRDVKVLLKEARLLHKVVCTQLATVAARPYPSSTVVASPPPGQASASAPNSPTTPRPG